LAALTSATANILPPTEPIRNHMVHVLDRHGVQAGLVVKHPLGLRLLQLGRVALWAPTVSMPILTGLYNRPHPKCRRLVCDTQDLRKGPLYDDGYTESGNDHS